MSERTESVVAWLLGIGLAVAVLFSAATAQAQPPPTPQCPEAPAVYEGNDVVVAELRLARAEAGVICAVQADRAEQLRTRVGDVHDRLADLETALDQIATNTTPPAQPPAPEVVRVEGVDPHVLGEQAEAAVNDLNQTLWWFGGALVAALAGWALLRQVMPR